MSISTYPIRCNKLIIAAASTFLLAACASGPVPTQEPPRQSVPTVRPSELEVPNVLIKGKTARSILDSIVKYRTQKGMKVLQRDDKRVELGMPVPKSNPPAEARMIYSISPAPDGLRLSAQVFQVIRQSGKPQTRDITSSLRDKLDEELASYAR